MTRQGTRYDKQLVHLAEKWLQDGTKTFVKRHADDLWKCAMDGDKLTERERETLRYMLGKFPFEDEAKEHLAKLVGVCSASRALASEKLGSRKYVHLLK